MSGRINDRFRSKIIDFSGLISFLKSVHPHKTCEAVEARCGVPATTVRKWVSGETSPNGAALIVVILAYGPEAFASCVTCAPRWLETAVRLEMARKLSEQIERDQRSLKELTNIM